MAGTHEGLSLGYRIGWRVRRIAMGIFGPAQLGEQNDPAIRLKKERAERVAAARAARERREAGGSSRG